MHEDEDEDDKPLVRPTTRKEPAEERRDPATDDEDLLPVVPPRPPPFAPGRKRKELQYGRIQLPHWNMRYPRTRACEQKILQFGAEKTGGEALRNIIKQVVRRAQLEGPPSEALSHVCRTIQEEDDSPGYSAACTASAADRILDCNFANAMSRARLFGGTQSADCTGAGRTMSAARLSTAHGLASYTKLASCSTITLA